METLLHSLALVVPLLTAGPVKATAAPLSAPQPAPVAAAEPTPDPQLTRRSGLHMEVGVGGAVASVPGATSWLDFVGFNLRTEFSFTFLIGERLRLGPVLAHSTARQPGNDAGDASDGPRTLTGPPTPPTFADSKVRDDSDDVSVADGILYCNTARTDPIHQWTSRLEGGGGFRSLFRDFPLNRLLIATFLSVLPLPEGAAAAEVDSSASGAQREEKATANPEEKTEETGEAADPIQKAPQRFAARDNAEGLPTVRGTFAFGGQVAVPFGQLNSSLGPVGAGGQLSLGFAPAAWPVLFGLSLDLLSFGSSEFDYEASDVQFTSHVSKLSHRGQLFVRAQPERGKLRPYLDLLGGYWLLAFNHEQTSSEEDNLDTVRASVTGAWGLRAGVDWLFGIGPNLGHYGVGFDVQYSRGGPFSFPDLSTAEGDGSAVTIPGSFTVQAPSELLFTLSFVVSSSRGNWVTTKPKVTVK